MTDEGDPAFVRHDRNVSLADGLQVLSLLALLVQKCKF
jgi:hypothetical protein